MNTRQGHRSLGVPAHIADRAASIESVLRSSTAPHIVTPWPRKPQKPARPYLGTALNPVPPQVAVQVMLKNPGAMPDVSPQRKAPGEAWVTQMTGRVGI